MEVARMNLYSPISARKRVLSLGLALVFLVALVPAAPGTAFALLGQQDDAIPGVPLSPQMRGLLPGPVDTVDVYRIHMRVGERATFTLTQDVAPPTENFDIYVWPTSATDFSGAWIFAMTGLANPHTATFVAPNDGWFYVQVSNATPLVGSGYTLKTQRWWLTNPGPATPERIWGSDRYSTAVEIAEKNFPGWVNCDHVVLASGEDRAAADPLSASGLTWTYGAPILLTQADRVPSSVMNAIKAIGAANGGVTVHVVGGPVSVPDARLSETAAEVPGATFDRIAPNNDRFVLAGSIARRMATERPDGWNRTDGFGQMALIANGADPDKFFDALALSPLTASTGYPILLVNQDSIPSATTSALNDLGIMGRLVGGGPATVSNGVLAELAAGTADSVRWAGSDRYETAVTIANGGMDAPPHGWVVLHSPGVTAKLPDALTGGAFTGLRGSPVLLTQTDAVPSSTRQFLHDRTGRVGECYVLGGPASVTDATMDDIRLSLIP
jgi:putative cell wall-binding protein